MTSPAKKTCFVLSPIGDEKSAERLVADKVLKHLIRKALSDAYDVVRADEDTNPGMITSSMIASILNADLIVADLSGHNPNVFYELAVAHGFRKPTVQLLRTGDRIPFDVKDGRTVRYDISDLDSVEAAQKTLRSYAQFAETNPEKIETPLTAGTEFVAVQASVDPATESNLLILDEIKSLRSEVRRLVRNPVRNPARSQSLASEQDREYNADIDSLMAMVRRVVEGGRALPDDFEGVIGPFTSSRFDDWARLQYSTVTGEDDAAEINNVLHSEMLRELINDSDQEPS